MRGEYYERRDYESRELREERTMRGENYERRRLLEERAMR